MQHVTNKLLLKGIKNTENQILDPNLTPDILNQINSKNKRQALKRHLNDDEKILD